MLRYSIDLGSLHQLTGFRGSEEVIVNVNFHPKHKHMSNSNFHTRRRACSVSVMRYSSQ
jgi:hypothetical protein